MEIPLDHVESAVAIPSQRERRYIQAGIVERGFTDVVATFSIDCFVSIK